MCACVWVGERVKNKSQVREKSKAMIFIEQEKKKFSKQQREGKKLEQHRMFVGNIILDFFSFYVFLSPSFWASHRLSLTGTSLRMEPLLVKPRRVVVKEIFLQQRPTFLPRTSSDKWSPQCCSWLQFYSYKTFYSDIPKNLFDLFGQTPRARTTKKRFTVGRKIPT